MAIPATANSMSSVSDSLSIASASETIDAGWSKRQIAHPEHRRESHDRQDRDHALADHGAAKQADQQEHAGPPRAGAMIGDSAAQSMCGPLTCAAATSAIIVRPPCVTCGICEARHRSAQGSA